MKIVENNPYTGEMYHSRGVTVLHEGEVPYLTFGPMDRMPWVRLAFSTRLGGVSRGICESMNLSFSRGDDPETVEENFRRIADAAGFDRRKIVFSDQVHETRILRVSSEDACGEELREKKLSGVDGLVTDEPGLMLATSYADCVPVFLADPVHRVVAAAHSGWRGTVAKIGRLAVERLAEEYGSRPEDLTAVIGPSICASCYEVSEEVAEACRENFRPEEVRRFLHEKGGGKYQLDLWLAVKCALLEAGLSEEKIFISGACTCCNEGLLWSHRATKGKRGNMLGFIGIVES
ncbi:MAG: peptidoglycan editing factor PgeF [Lachnospiraceae bacterium]|nr:peptidoglycan editing factor PgeF [Lachnospiraceae bacterium]